MAATMKDIARRTGLGLATISSYFNGGNVREKNRIKIEEAIEDQCDQDSGGCDSRAEQCFLRRNHQWNGGYPPKPWICSDCL